MSSAWNGCCPAIHKARACLCPEPNALDVETRQAVCRAIFSLQTRRRLAASRTGINPAATCLGES